MTDGDIIAWLRAQGTPEATAAADRIAALTAPGRRGFVPPTRDEVAAYCRERGNRVDAGRFCDYYASNGWYVGKNKMKDWRATVRRWEGADTGHGERRGGAGSAGYAAEII